MKRSKRFSTMIGLAFLAVLFARPQMASAKDDFGKIVHHIETQYHVHRQHRFAMGMAGFVVKFWHFAGVKNLKGAIFENQQFVNAASDTRFDEIVRAAMDSGWQPMVQPSWSSAPRRNQACERRQDRVCCFKRTKLERRLPVLTESL